ncbi:MAG: DNA polymerase III subunit [Verrucomicrobiota bacterium]
MSFTDFPEQERVVQLLQRSLERRRLAHAYLFSGNNIEVLEAVARTLAKTLNCQDAPRKTATGLNLDCCDQCSSCRRIHSLGHPDVSWLRAESKSRIISIDQVRGLLQSVNLKPTDAEFKVGVLVAVDRLKMEAANAFLKTLEEPPPKSILILLTTEPQRILETIQSRCLRLNFAAESARLGEAEAGFVAGFSEIAAKENRGLLGRYRLLGVLMKNLGEQKEAVEKELTSRSPLERHDDLDPKLREKWEDELAAAVEAEYRRRRGDLLLALEWWFRDVWTQTLSAGSGMLTFPQLKMAATTVARRISSSEAVENLQILEQTQRLLGSNVQEALALEVGLLKLKL